MRRILAVFAVALALVTPALAGKGPVFSNDFLKLIFNATPIANLADNASTSPLTNLYVALHTADPSTTAGSGTVNTQNASEIAYGGYARVATARTTAAWTVTGNSVSPVAPGVTFPVSTSGTGTATYWSVGTSATLAGKILYSGPLSPSIVVGSSGITPVISSSSTITEAAVMKRLPTLIASARDGRRVHQAHPGRSIHGTMAGRLIEFRR